MLALGGLALLAGSMSGGLLVLFAPIGGILLSCAFASASPLIVGRVVRLVPHVKGSTLRLAADSIERLPRRWGALATLVATGAALVSVLALVAIAVLHTNVTGAFIGAVVAIVVVMMIGTALLSGTAFVGSTISNLRARERELRVLRSVGLPRRRMLSMLTLEAAIVGFVGGVAGGLVSLAVIGAVLMSTTLTVGVLGFGVVIAVVVGSTLIAAGATLVPAWRSTLSPV